MTAKQSGQTLPLVALMMVCIMGVAALAVDGSNAYSQQRRMQADLDMAVKVAADDLPNTNAAQMDATNLLVQRGYTNPGITINVPPQTAPYMQKPCPPSVPQPCYTEGFLTQNVHSFFAGVLGLQQMKISVHAVAEKGGNTVQPPQLLALSPDGASNGGCGVLAWGSASGVLDANVHSNSQTCRGNASLFATGKVFSDIPTSNNNGSPITSTVNSDSGNGNGMPMTNPYDPDWPVPGSLPPASNGTKCNSRGGCTSSVCDGRYPIAYGDTYYQPYPNYNGVALIDKALNVGSGTTDFLPYCDSKGNPTFGIYLFNADFQQSSNNSVVNVYDSTFVFNYSTGARLYVTGGSLNMWGPGYCPPSVPQPCAGSTSPFYGINGTTSSIAIWQVNATPCGTPVGMQNSGGGAGTIIGIVDLPCTNITVTGSSSNSAWIHGALVAWDITVGGSGSGIVTQDPVAAPALPSGAVLVQ